MAVKDRRGERPRKTGGWYGDCQRCGTRTDRAFIPDTNWLVCILCYLTWRELPADHPGKRVSAVA